MIYAMPYRWYHTVMLSLHQLWIEWLAQRVVVSKFVLENTLIVDWLYIMMQVTKIALLEWLNDSALLTCWLLSYSRLILSYFTLSGGNLRRSLYLGSVSLWRDGDLLWYLREIHRRTYHYRDPHIWIPVGQFFLQSDHHHCHHHLRGPQNTSYCTCVSLVHWKYWLSAQDWFSCSTGILKCPGFSHFPHHCCTTGKRRGNHC